MLRPEIDESFDSGIRNDLATVANTVADIIGILFQSSDPPTGPRRIHCVYCDQDAPTVQCRPTEYRITLTVNSRDFCNFTYQLSHELGHIMMDPRPTNWVVEAFAVALSHAVLGLLSGWWRSNPPYLHWAYVYNFSLWSKRVIDQRLKNFDPELLDALRRRNWQAVTAYLGQQRAKLESDPYDRALNTLCAVRLMAEPIPWPEIRGLASLTTPPPLGDGDFKFNVQLDHAKLSDSMKRLLLRLGL